VFILNVPRDPEDDSREYADHEFEQADIDELFAYAKNTLIKQFFSKVSEHF
jgi:hypothetical protein